MKWLQLLINNNDSFRRVNIDKEVIYREME